MKSPLALIAALLTTLACDYASAQTIVKCTGSDDGPAIQKALNSYSSVALESNKVYQTSVYLIVPDNRTFNGNGSTLKPHSNLPVSNTAMIDTLQPWYARTYTASNLSVPITGGSYSFNYSGAANIKAGQIVEIWGDVYYNGSSSAEYYRHGWYGLVSSVSGSTVTLANKAYKNFTARQITAYNAAKNVYLKNLHIDVRGRSTGYGAAFTHALNSRMDNVSVEGDDNTSTGVSVGIRAIGVNITIDKASVKNIKPLASGSGVSYGIDVGGYNITVSNPYIRNVETCLTSAGRDYYSTGINFLNVDIDNMKGSGHSLDFHGNATGTMKGGIVIGGANGAGPIAVRQANTTVSDLVIKMPNPNGLKTKRGIFLFEFACSNIFVSNNRFEYYNATNGVSYAIGHASGMPPLKNITFKGNELLGSEVNFANSLSTVLIQSNWFETYGKFPSRISIATSQPGAYTISGNTFVNRIVGKFNYCMSTPTAAATGKIDHNRIYVTDPNNSSPQIRINNTVNTVQYNVGYLSSNPLCKLIFDTTGSVGVNGSTGNATYGITTPPARPAIP